MATTASETTPLTERRLVAELVPEQVLPKVLGTFDGIGLYVYIIFFINASAIVALGGWPTTQLWILGVIVFLLPAAMAVAELGNVWPAQGGVYVWTAKTMPGWVAFFAGFLSWVPIVLVGATHPAVEVALLQLAFHFSPSTTVSILLQLILLWIPISLALMRLRPSRNLANGVFLFYMLLVALVVVAGVAIALRDGHSANPVHSGDFTKLNFSLYGSYFGLILLNFTGVEAPFNMGAEVIASRRTLVRMVLWGTVIVVLGYILTSTSILLATPIKNINAATGAVQVLSGLHASGLVPVVAIFLVVAFIAADLTYQQTYARLVFVSGLERHLPRIFTHLNPRTKNPVTALLFTGALISVIIVIFYSQQSLNNAFLTLEGAMTIMWLLAGIFFFVPVLLARRRYAERYKDSFWRIPGGMTGAAITVLVGLAGTCLGIYYTYIEPFSSSIKKSTWTITVTVVCGGLLLMAAIIYRFGRRAGGRQSEEELLASMIDQPPANERSGA